MTDPLDRLSAALSDRYRLERELGGGGMSRVFVAEEMGLGRTVVLKAIGPEFLEGVSAERFAREIQLAALPPEGSPLGGDRRGGTAPMSDPTSRLAAAPSALQDPESRI